MSYSPGTRQMIAWTKLDLCNHRPSYLGSNVIGSFAFKTWKLEIQLGLSWYFQRMLYYPDQVPHRFRCPQRTADTLKNLSWKKRERQWAITDTGCIDADWNQVSRSEWEASARPMTEHTDTKHLTSFTIQALLLIPQFFSQIPLTPPQILTLLL